LYLDKIHKNYNNLIIMKLTEKSLRKTFLRGGAWVHNPEKPILLTVEPDGDEHYEFGGTSGDVLWAEKNSWRSLGKYALKPSTSLFIAKINVGLLINDGMGEGAERILEEANETIERTRFSLGGEGLDPHMRDIDQYIEENEL